MTAWYENPLDRGLFPDAMVRFGIRRRLASRLAHERRGGVERTRERVRRFIEQLRTSPIAWRRRRPTSSTMSCLRNSSRRSWGRISSTRAPTGSMEQGASMTPSERCWTCISNAPASRTGWTCSISGAGGGRSACICARDTPVPRAGREQLGLAERVHRGKSTLTRDREPGGENRRCQRLRAGTHVRPCRLDRDAGAREELRADARADRGLAERRGACLHPYLHTQGRCVSIRGRGGLDRALLLHGRKHALR